MRRFIFLLVALSGLSLTACSVHKIDIQQGNVITREMLEKLSPGMDKRRVKLAIGSPLVQDPFNPNRWDYVYSFIASMRNEKQSAHIILYFDGDTLTKIDVVKPPPDEKDVMMPTLRGQGF